MASKITFHCSISAIHNNGMLVLAAFVELILALNIFEPRKHTVISRFIYLFAGLLSQMHNVVVVDLALRRFTEVVPTTNAQG